MKIIISESFLSAHFAERLKQRIPIGLKQSIKDRISTNVGRIKDFTFTDFFFKNKIQVEIIKLNSFNLYAIIKDNILITIVRSKKPYGSLPLIENFIKFEEELKFIKTNIKSGKYYYKIPYETVTYYFIINENKIINYISDLNELETYINQGYIQYAVD